MTTMGKIAENFRRLSKTRYPSDGRQLKRDIMGDQHTEHAATEDEYDGPPADHTTDAMAFALGGFTGRMKNPAYPPTAADVKAKMDEATAKATGIVNRAQREIIDLPGVTQPPHTIKCHHRPGAAVGIYMPEADTMPGVVTEIRWERGAAEPKYLVQWWRDGEIREGLFLAEELQAE